MSCASPTLRTNGTLKDVAAFLCVGERTLWRWNMEKPPRIAFHCGGVGGANVYLEDDVVGYVSKHYVADHRMSPEEIRELVRRQWREHLQFRAGDLIFEQLKTVEHRLQELELVIAKGRSKTAQEVAA